MQPKDEEEGKAPEQVSDTQDIGKEKMTKEEVGEFWEGDDLWKGQEQSGSVTYKVREFKDEEEKTLMERKAVIISEWLYFFILLVIGIVLLVVGNQEADKIRGLISSMLFAGGFIPAVTLVFYDVLPNFMSRYQPIKKCLPETLHAKNKVDLDDGFSLLLSAVFVLVAVLMNLHPGESETSWLVKVGTSFADAGLIYMIRRVCFFYEDPRDVKRELEKEIEDLKKSAAIGIADGYYWNFLKEVCEKVKKNGNSKMKVVKIVRYENGEPEYEEPIERLIDPILVLLPRNVNLKEDDPIQRFINTTKTMEECILYGSHERPNEDNKRRMKSLRFKTRGNTHAVVVDIPTCLLPFIKGIKATGEGASDEDASGEGASGEDATGEDATGEGASGEGASGEDIRRYQKEIRFFGNRLCWWLKKEGLEKYVKIVEIDGDETEIEERIEEVSCET